MGGKRSQLETYYRVITCYKCGLPGGTLVKIDDKYCHQDEKKCLTLQMRRKQKLDVKEVVKWEN